ncbi:phage portal protein [Mesorhizobium sp. INR15]|uniref:phage portal protein n=1 Tax=Mesorhizobium sp. INR15 TaxID=2654248 RepID=UPI0018963EE6|nr:phage portal protein [Mesorhizobium sp. INR15]QPC91440.1 phage portal protein [Mesorhizobium sp. INR15]
MNNLDLTDLLGSDAGVSPAIHAAHPPVASAVAAGGGVAYDGADRLNRLADWQPALRSADADLLPSKDDLDARSLDTGRNDAYVAGGATIRKDSIVGTRFLLNAKPETKVLFGKEDETWEAEAQEEIETKFTLYAESDQCWPDARRTKTLTDIVRLAVGVHLMNGESLQSAEWFDDGRPYASAVQTIDPARLSDPRDRIFAPFKGSRLRKGVESDTYGAPIAYYIRNAHQADYRNGGVNGYLDNMKWKRVPARKPWGRMLINHVYEELRPDQTRGVSAMVSALTEMRMTKHFRKTELERAVVAATYAASIESEIPTDVAAALGAANSGEGNATTQWMTDYLATIAQYSSGAKNLHMDGAKIPIFAPGTKLKIQNPGAASPQGDKFEQSLLRYIAAALGVSYEQLSRDYTQTNYSSARASLGETFKTMLSLKRIVADKTANFIYRLWLEEAINYNELECFKRRDMPRFYDGLNAEAFSSCEWIGAGQGQIDPLKETQASVLKIKNGLSTKETEIAKMSGGDWRKTARQIKRERDLDEKYGNPSVYDQNTKNMQNSLTAKPRDGGKAMADTDVDEGALEEAL